MTIEIVMPKIGLNMEEGMIVEWVKKEGDNIKPGDVLFVLETDKVTVESEAQQEGVLAKIFVQEGERVPVKTPVALMVSEGEIYADETPPTEKLKAASTPKQSDSTAISAGQVQSSSSGKILASPKAKYHARQYGLNLDQIAASVRGIIKSKHVIGYAKKAQTSRQQVLATPLAKRIAKNKGLDLMTVEGTGVSGRITRRDVDEALQSQIVTKQPVPAEKSVPIKGVRAIIAERMLQSSQNSAPVTLHSEVDATKLVEYRQTRKESNHSIIPSYNAIIVSLVAEALVTHPKMNARIDGKNIQLLDLINIGLGVDYLDGLRVVVVKNANQKSVAQIQVDLVDLINRVQTNSSALDDFSGGTFTITNLGPFGIDRFTPIINLSESGILGVGRISEKLVLKEGKIAQRSMMTLSLTFDHRVIDGAPAARFMQTIVHLIEEFE
jgi:pyruvate dehydrogenase E2 component (dihydrolipoamide acetyltransferase)